MCKNYMFLNKEEVYCIKNESKVERKNASGNSDFLVVK